MISLFPWLYFLQYLLQEYEEQETWWENQYEMGLGSFFCLGKSITLYRCYIFLLITFSETFFKLQE